MGMMALLEFAMPAFALAELHCALHCFSVHYCDTTLKLLGQGSPRVSPSRQGVGEGRGPVSPQTLLGELANLLGQFKCLAEGLSFGDHSVRKPCRGREGVGEWLGPPQPRTYLLGLLRCHWPSCQDQVKCSGQANQGWQAHCAPINQWHSCVWVGGDGGKVMASVPHQTSCRRLP